MLCPPQFSASQPADPPGTFTSDLIAPSLIPTFLTSSHAKKRTKTAILASSKTVHCRPRQQAIWSRSSDNDPQERGTDVSWGCGYRNAQMLLSATVHMECYTNLFSQSFKLKEGIPTILQIQQLIEKAWCEEGFDAEGAAHFGCKLVGKRKWIGTTEVYVLLTHSGVRCNIIDFPGGNESVGAHTALANWIINYFEEGTTSSASTPIKQTNKMPLYLQHDGHSRTVVGVEQSQNGDWNLLIFDPAKIISATLRQACAKLSAQPQPRTVEKAKVVIDLTGVDDDPAPESQIYPQTNETANVELRGGFGSCFTSSKKRKRIVDQNNTRPQDESRAKLEATDPNILLRPFRVTIKSLSRKSQYQVLCIDESGPALSQAERELRRKVTSTVIMS